jgi:Leucine-rich repeat (LRR) protein
MNMLNTIEVLNKFGSLRVIIATNCYIEEVNLRLPKLEVLDLSNNFIKNFPILASMHKLKALNLNSNKLVDLK